MIRLTLASLALALALIVPAAAQEIDMAAEQWARELMR